MGIVSGKNRPANTKTIQKSQNKRYKNGYQSFTKLFRLLNAKSKAKVYKFMKKVIIIRMKKHKNFNKKNITKNLLLTST